MANGNGNGGGKTARPLNWPAGLSAVGGGATGAGLMAVATRAEPEQFLGGMLAWALVTIAGICTGIAAAWASRRFVHSDELKLQLAHEQQRVAELNERLRLREQELLKERADRIGEITRDWSERLQETKASLSEWQARFWTVAGIMNATTEQTATMVAAVPPILERTAQIVALHREDREDIPPEPEGAADVRGRAPEPADGTGTTG